MVERTRFTGERVIPGAAKSLDDHLMMLRHLAAYDLAGRLLAGHTPTLDLGCGAGYGTRRMAVRGIRMVGFDIDQDTVMQAAQRYAGDACTFLVYDGSTIPCRDGTFYGGAALQVIEHIEDDHRFVEEMSRVLKDGARAVLTTPNAALRLSPGERPWNRFHVREHDADSLQRLLAGCFGDVRIRGLIGSSTIQDLELRRLRRIRALSRLDPFHLRYHFPEFLNRRARALFRQVLSSRSSQASGSGSQVPPFEVGDFKFVETTEAALDLVAICRK